MKESICLLVCCLYVQRSHKEEEEAERERTKEEIAAAIAQERQRAKVGTAKPTLLKLTTTKQFSPICVKITALCCCFLASFLFFLYFPPCPLSLPSLFLIFSLLHSCLPFSFSPSIFTSPPSPSLPLPLLLLGAAIRGSERGATEVRSCSGESC